MRKRALVAVALTIGIARLADGQPCACGPDFCKDDPRHPKMLAAKKERLSKKYPAELVALLDRDGACVAAVDKGPDGFSLKTVAANGNKSTMAWTEDDERIARDDLVAGTLSAYYKFNASRRLACCGDKPSKEQADWDEVLDLNTGLAIACKKSGATAKCE